MRTSKNPDFRKHWRLNWLSALVALADPELQQRWLDKSITNPAWTYVEFMCSYFDDAFLTDSETDGGYERKLQDGWLTQNEYDCVKDFHAALNQYKVPTNQYDHIAILKDPAWQKIIAAGQQAVVKLRILIIDENEKKVLNVRPALTKKDYTWPN